MSFSEILRLPMRLIPAHKLLAAFMVLAIVMATVYPSDLDRHRAANYAGHQMPLIVFTEDYGRHLNSIAALGTALVLRDLTGLKQLAVIIVVGIAATHGPKRLLNNVEVMGTRLGERPSRQTSNHNMPSGHSALASAVIWFLGRRYSWWWLLLTVPVTLMTMLARVLLDAHTISAVIAGMLVGLAFTMLFVTPCRRNEHQERDEGRGKQT